MTTLRLLNFGGDKYQPRRDRKNLYQIAELYAVTLLDPSFQRLGGVFNGSGWSYSNACDYLNSILEGSVENKIILAHVKDCLRYAEDIGDQKSINYFSNVKKLGYEYVSIDGNNTSSAVFAWLRGRPVSEKVVKQKVVETFLVSSKLKEAIPSSEGMFTKLDISQQQDIHTTEKLDVTVYHSITIDEMCTKFRKTNTSTHLNAQEYRQARVSELADWVRNLVKENRDIFKNLLQAKASTFDKRIPDEMIAQLALFISTPNHATDMVKKAVDAFYENTPRLELTSKRKVEEILNETLNVATKVGVLQTKLSKPELIHLWYFTHILHTAGYRVVNRKAYFNWFCETNITLGDIAGDLPSKESEFHSYREWLSRCCQSNYHKRTVALFQEIIKKQLPTKLEEGTVKKVRTGKDVFSAFIKKKLLVRQNFTDRNGREITPLDFYMGNLHADHVVSVKDGGKTVIENAEMMFAEDNLKKGSKSNKPHFPHQIIQEKCNIVVDKV